MRELSLVAGLLGLAFVVTVAIAAGYDLAGTLEGTILALASVLCVLVTLASLAGAVGYWRRAEWATVVLGVLVDAAIVAVLLQSPTAGDRRGTTV